MSPARKASLFETTIRDQDLDPAYLQIRDSDFCNGDREYIDGLWARYQDYADSNFHDQLQRKGQFHSRVWEMRLACILMDRGFDIESSDQGPDIRIPGDVLVHVEAVAPATTGELEANHGRARRATVPVPQDATILRYTSSLQEKWNAYLRYRRNGLVGAADAYVIALSAGNLRWASSGDGPPWILKPLFGLGSLFIEIEAGTGREVGGGYKDARTRIKVNEQGEKVPIEGDLFLSEKRSGVSAVLFSPRHVVNRPEVFGRPEGSDLLLCHNPFADVPLPEGFLGTGREWAVRDGYLQIINDWTPQEEDD